MWQMSSQQCAASHLNLVYKYCGKSYQDSFFEENLTQANKDDLSNHPFTIIFMVVFYAGKLLQNRLTNSRNVAKLTYITTMRIWRTRKCQKSPYLLT